MPLLGDNKTIHKASLTFLKGHIANQGVCNIAYLFSVG